MLVRPARVEDAVELARVHTQSSDAAYSALGLDDPGAFARVDGWTRVFDSADYAPHLVEVNGEIIGVLNVGPARDTVDCGEVYVLYVHSAWWGSGAGQLLLERAHDLLERKYTAAVLTVLAANPRARRFYERNGWVLAETRIEPHFRGRPVEVAIYRKAFDPA